MYLHSKKNEYMVEIIMPKIKPVKKARKTLKEK